MRRHWQKNDERQVLVGSVLNRTCDFSPTAVLMLPIKAAVQHSDHRLHAADPADCCNDGFFQAGLARSSGQFPDNQEMQHIVGRNVRVQLFKSSVVQNRAEPIIGADCQMHPAVGADILALDPNLPRGTAAAFFALDNCGGTQLGAAVPASRRAFI